MRVVSSAVSLTAHVVLGALVLVGTTKRAQSTPPSGIDTLYIVPPSPSRGSAGAEGPAIPLPARIPLDGGTISVSLPVIKGVPPLGPSFPVFVPTGAGTSGSADPWAGAIGEAGPEVLSGPLPQYPELLRQAGIQGRVVLEGVVDTSGHVLPPSIAVVRASNPAFVAPARQALLATLFRPALVGGRRVSMRVQIPYDFTIRPGTSF